MVELGYNYRLPDVQCALGLAQLERLPQWVARRRNRRAWYADALAGIAHVRPLHVHADRTNAYHLYVVRLDLAKLRSIAHARSSICARTASAPMCITRRSICTAITAAWAISAGLCPVAEQAYQEILTLPMFPAMSQGDVARVANVLRELRTTCADHHSDGVSTSGSSSAQAAQSRSGAVIAAAVRISSSSGSDVTPTMPTSTSGG